MSLCLQHLVGNSIQDDSLLACLRRSDNLVRSGAGSSSVFCTLVGAEANLIPHPPRLAWPCYHWRPCLLLASVNCWLEYYWAATTTSTTTWRPVIHNSPESPLNLSCWFYTVFSVHLGQLLTSGNTNGYLYKLLYKGLPCRFYWSVLEKWPWQQSAGRERVQWQLCPAMQCDWTECRWWDGGGCQPGRLASIRNLFQPHHSHGGQSSTQSVWSGRGVTGPSCSCYCPWPTLLGVNGSTRHVGLRCSMCWS